MVPDIPKEAVPSTGYVLNALAFSTLLSSQGADAHLQLTLVRLQGNYSNLPDGFPVVNQVPKNFSSQVGVPSAQPRLPDKLPWSCKACQLESLGVPVGAGLPCGVPFPGGQEEL